jgi:hypothetical protein
MSDDASPPQESPIITKIRNYVVGHGGLGGADQRETTTASNVDSSQPQQSWHAGNKISHDDDSVIHETGGSS